MSFKQKTDPYSIADGTSLVVLSTTGGETASNAEAVGEDGSIVANTVYGETSAPSCTLALKSDLTKNAGDWKIGAVSTASDKKYALGEINISTSAGGAPSISVSGEQVHADAATGCYYPVPAFTLSKKHHAQILFSAFSLGNVAGVHLTSAAYKISGQISKVTKEGSCIAFDIVQGRIEVTVTLKQCGSAAPALTAGTGFAITSPLAETNPDAEYPTFTATLVMYLAKADAAAQAAQTVTVSQPA